MIQPLVGGAGHVVSPLVVGVGSSSPAPLTDADLIQRVQQKYGTNQQKRTGIEAIVTTARSLGIDPLQALSLAFQESGFQSDIVVHDPDQHGNAGTSYGLFNLRQPGQGTGHTVSDLLDPWKNAQIFLGQHASLFQQLSGQYSGADLASKFGKQAEVSAGDGSAYGKKFSELLTWIGGVWNGGSGPSSSPGLPSGLPDYNKLLSQVASDIGHKLTGWAVSGVAGHAFQISFAVLGTILVIAAIFGLATPAVQEGKRAAGTATAVVTAAQKAGAALAAV